MTLPPGVMIPNDLERRQIFHALKRWSSYTAWNRILNYYRAWAQATEDSVREASDEGLQEKTRIPDSDYVFILKSLAHFEEGVTRLRQGDKRVFKFDANGEFVIGRRAVHHWFQAIRPDGQAGGIGPAERDSTPNWSTFERTFFALKQAMSECSPYIIEGRYPDAAAPTLYGVWMQEWLPRMSFPNPVPEVPDPAGHTLVYTGRNIPFSGIWEPVDAPAPKGLLAELFGKQAMPEGPLPIVGTMNYLHGGKAAPRAKQETESDSLRADVFWRLLWKDDRYEDGRIPDEEKDYVFLRPHDVEGEIARMHAEFDALYVPPVPPPSAPPPAPISVPAGRPCPRTGYWRAKELAGRSILVQQGDLMPGPQLGRAGSVVWVFEREA